MVMSANIEIEPDLLKTISEIAKNKGTSEKEVLNDIIKKGLEPISEKVDKE
ncbi:MAG: hypothetical protein LBT66_07070 [Methanobrevibacter sp.]|jgi:hypothetical protein|nr:hypothetical protein [Candidatus Methanovirga meridionalis]